MVVSERRSKGRILGPLLPPFAVMSDWERKALNDGVSYCPLRVTAEKEANDDKNLFKV